MLRTLVAFSLALLLASCAGRDFSRPEPDSLRLGQTTRSQILERYGDPANDSTSTTGGITITALTYSYASAPGKAHRHYLDWPVAVRAVVFQFSGDLLVGYNYSSSWADDHTDFDESKRSNFVKGSTTHTQVIQLLGKPGGTCIYPIIDERTGTGLTYHYFESSGSGHLRKTYRKFLLIAFDQRGVLSDVKYNSSRQ